MKRPETMIREYEAEHDIHDTYFRLYTYVRPRPNGEATIEVWGARNNARRKGQPLCVKHFFTFRTEDDNYRTKDTLWYTSYSPMVHDHICYHAPEIGGGNYAYALHDMVGKWGWRKHSKTREVHLPTWATMLNGWDGTKYKYCAYDIRSGMSAISYIKLYAKYPCAEILSKAKMFQLLEEKFLRHVTEDKEFCSYVARNRNDIALHHMTVGNIETAWKRHKTCAEYQAVLQKNRDRYAALREDRERARQERARIEHERYLKEQRIKARNDNKAIRALYERLKSICGIYGCFEVIVPKSSAEMFKEGKLMHNCVGAMYASRHAHAKDIIVFLHKDGKPCVDMRINPTTFKIEEIRFTCNKDATSDTEVMTEANKVLKNFKKVWKKVA